VTYDFKAWGHSSTGFVTINNLFDQDPPLYASAAFTGNPGFYYPVPTGYDLVGRYYNVGLRFKF
jgi:outer membrane receptor protein involved in Fe transport